MSDTRFCGACGQPNSIQARFCGKCGSALGAMPAPAQPLPKAPAPAPAPVPARPAAQATPGRAPLRTMMAASVDPAEMADHVARLQAGQPAPAAAPAAAPGPGVVQPAPPVQQGHAPTIAQPAAQYAPAAPPAAAAPPAPAYTPPSSYAQAAGDAPPATGRVLDGATLLDQPLIPDPSAAGTVKTMMGMSFPELADATDPGAPPQAMAAPSAPAAAAPEPPPPAPPAPAAAPQAAAPEAAERPRDAILRSMLGGAPAESAPAPAPPASPPSPSPAPLAAAPTAGTAKPRARTMLGMAFAPGSLPTAQPAAAPAPESVSVPAGPAPMGPVDAVGPTVAAPTPTPPAVAPAARKPLGPSHRTMLGVAAPPELLAKAQAQLEARAAPPHAAAMPMAAPIEPSADVSIAGLPSPRRRTNALLAVVLLLGTLVVVGSIGAYFLFGRGSGRAIAVSVGHGEAGELLHVEVPGLPAGSHARFGGADTPFAGNAAELPLAADALHVGDNPLAIDLVLPDGTVETHQVTLTLTYRVRADLSSLTGTPPSIGVVVEALAGSTVVLDGQPITLDGAGRGTRSYPLDGLTPSAEGVVEHVALYTITPPGTPPGAAPATGSLTTRVPLTTMHIDRPADEAITDQAEVEIAGAVLAGATLTIDGAAVTVLPEGRFLHRYPLAAPGDFAPRIVATAANRAPAVRTLRIRRVADLAREAAGFTFDRSLTYARLATAPTTFTGQRVMYEGRVYNVDVHDGRGVLQMLVRDCPSGQRCPLWVSYAAATEVTVESWVRIYGTVEGEQQFRSTTGEVRTVPSVAATFVLPARP